MKSLIRSLTPSLPVRASVVNDAPRSPCAPSRPRAVAATVLLLWDGLRRLRMTWREWSQNARSRRQLATLPDHLLKDVGLNRCDVDREVRKPRWRS